MAIFKENMIVGHVPYNIAPNSQFLKRENKACAKMVGEKLNRE